ncbi:GAF and ANTAR domain-containing protein [Streptomyces sp. Qhu-G9]|uniref:GAF and ANTAR domain-containing protein n=1 Tax=Streptomyces sp. Qhu-G9 TaxID=3452799 RepID=UPI0022ABF47A|nr:GAF and ANTAR domain-containing protein [Streptomyces aurantiacus]WAU83266.1 GAF and ANTAR domain-containing protein [Streptomyces aurantiacus]
MNQLSQPPAEEGCPAAGPDTGLGSGSGASRWRQNDLDQRNRLYGHHGVARAQEVLVKRYGFASTGEAFALLKDISQRCNIKLATLADAVVRTPAPDHDTELWFPNRPRYDPPGLPFLPGGRDRHTSQGLVLKAVLHRVLSITQTPMGNVQLAESGRLRLARHAGLNKYFTDFFAFVDASTTLCSQAAAERRQVTVRDVATSPLFDEASRHAVLQANSRAAHSVPLVNRAGVPLGMVSSHHEQPLAGFTHAQLAALWQTGVDSGRWLSWHWNTVVLDALEQLHTTARNGTRN